MTDEFMAKNKILFSLSAFGEWYVMKKRSKNDLINLLHMSSGLCITLRHFNSDMRFDAAIVNMEIQRYLREFHHMKNDKIRIVAFS